MDLQQIQNVIETELQKRKKSVRNRNAISAFLGAFSDPVGALGQVFIGREEAMDAERRAIAQEVMLEMLCKIDEAISQANTATTSKGITINGLIETNAQSVDNVVAVHIGENSGAVTLQNGTHIRTTATDAKSVTALKIGGN